MNDPPPPGGGLFDYLVKSGRKDKAQTYAQAKRFQKHSSPANATNQSQPGSEPFPSALHPHKTESQPPNNIQTGNHFAAGTDNDARKQIAAMQATIDELTNQVKLLQQVLMKVAPGACAEMGVRAPSDGKAAIGIENKRLTPALESKHAQPIDSTNKAKEAKPAAIHPDPRLRSEVVKLICRSRGPVAFSVVVDTLGESFSRPIFDQFRVHGGEYFALVDVIAAIPGIHLTKDGNPMCSFSQPAPWIPSPEIEPWATLDRFLCAYLLTTAQIIVRLSVVVTAVSSHLGREFYQECLTFGNYGSRRSFAEVLSHFPNIVLLQSNQCCALRDRYEHEVECDSHSEYDNDDDDECLFHDEDDCFEVCDDQCSQISSRDLEAAQAAIEQFLEDPSRNTIRRMQNDLMVPLRDILEACSVSDEERIVVAGYVIATMYLSKWRNHRARLAEVESVKESRQFDFLDNCLPSLPLETLIGSELAAVYSLSNTHQSSILDFALAEGGSYLAELQKTVWEISCMDREDQKFIVSQRLHSLGLKELLEFFESVVQDYNESFKSAFSPMATAAIVRVSKGFKDDSSEVMEKLGELWAQCPPLTTGRDLVIAARSLPIPSSFLNAVRSKLLGRVLELSALETSVESECFYRLCVNENNEGTKSFRQVLASIPGVCVSAGKDGNKVICSLVTNWVEVLDDSTPDSFSLSWVSQPEGEAASVCSVAFDLFNAKKPANWDTNRFWSCPMLPLVLECAKWTEMNAQFGCSGYMILTMHAMKKKTSADRLAFANRVRTTATFQYLEDSMKLPPDGSFLHLCVIAAFTAKHRSALVAAVSKKDLAFAVSFTRALLCLGTQSADWMTQLCRESFLFPVSEVDKVLSNSAMHPCLRLGTAAACAGSTSSCPYADKPRDACLLCLKQTSHRLSENCLKTNVAPKEVVRSLLFNLT